MELGCCSAGVLGLLMSSPSTGWDGHWGSVPVPATSLECFGDRGVAEGTPGVLHRDL